jgi:hypothetical protein
MKLPFFLINCCVRDDWSEITEDFLEKKYQEISKKTHLLEKLYADYWINLIISFKKRPQ